HRAVAGIGTFDLARDQPIGNGTQAGAAILLRQRGTKQPELAHAGEHVAVEALLPKGLDDARKQRVLRKSAGAVAHPALLFGQLAFEAKRILPVELARKLRRARLALALALGAGLGGCRHDGCSLEVRGSDRMAPI